MEEISFAFFHGKAYHGYAHAKENPELIFYVGQNRYTTKETEDSYLDQTWQKQAKDELGPIVEHFFPDSFHNAVDIY
ncbi:hypothetical protein [Perspicuibacillus lycopersici]|nr:hypothetical protein [Perspicuibacillus lycopersici]